AYSWTNYLLDKKKAKRHTMVHDNERKPSQRNSTYGMLWRKEFVGVWAVGIRRDRGGAGKGEKRSQLWGMERDVGKATLFAFSKVVWTADKIFGKE
ncbi:MAG: hypothetical protein U0586_08390, partial [Candidatus Brocadiaceae bacterium]